MKKFLLASTLIFAACTKPPSNMVMVQWNSKSTAPNPIKSLKTNKVSKVKTRWGNVEFSNQMAGEFKIDRSFIKSTFSKKDRLDQLVARVETTKLSEVDIEKWRKLAAKKDETLRRLIKENHFAKLENFDFLVTQVKGKIQPAWSLEYSDEKGEMWRKSFDLKLRELSLKKLGSCFAQTGAWVFPNGPKSSGLQEVQLFDLLKGNGLISPFMHLYTATSEPVDVTGGVLQFATSDVRFDQVQAFYNIQRALTWFESEFGFKTTQKLDVMVHVGNPQKTNTAFYYKGNIRLGSGDDETYSKIPWDPSLVSHETAHYMIDQVAKLPTESEGGSLNEAFADYFAASMLDNPKLGESSYLKSSYKRRLDQDRKWTEKNGSLYGDSLIVSSLLWSLREDLGETVDKVAFQVLMGLNPESKFLDFKNALVEVTKQNLGDESQRKLMALLKEREWPVE